MNNSTRTLDDTLLIAAGAALAALLMAGCGVYLAAQAVLLISEQRLLLPGSGSMLDTAAGLFAHPADPASAFTASDRAHLPSGLWLYGLAAPILGALLATAAHAWRLATARTRRPTSDGRWARSGELKALRVTQGGEGRLVLGKASGKLIATEGDHSVIVFGPTGSGKTTALVVPALLEHPGPAVALSVKTDLLRDTLTHRARNDRPVYIYDPLNLTEHDCAAWTPLRTCHDWAEAQRMAEALASAMVDGSVNDSRFWNAMASKMLEALLHAAALDKRTMRDVVRWVDTREQVEVAQILEKHKAHHALQSWGSSLTRDERTLSGVYASTEVLLRAYSTPGMTDSLAADCFDPNEMIAAGGTLYVCAPTEDQARLRPIFAALVKDVYRAAVLHAERTGRLNPSLLMVLDEAANIAPVHDLAEIASTCRAYGVQLVTVFQDLAQVQARYGPKARTLVNNHTAKLLLPGASDRELLDLLTRLLGDERVDQVTRSHSVQGSSRSHSTRYRPLAAMNELRQLKQGTALLLYGNLPPTQLTLRPFYKDPQLRRLAHKDQP